MLPWIELFNRWRIKGNLVVALLQDKTDTQWFEDLFYTCDDLYFLKGRVQFLGKETKTGNNRGAIVAVYYDYYREQRIGVWDWRNEEFPL